jgi:hypothetical protein
MDKVGNKEVMVFEEISATKKKPSILPGDK